jgi:hypothetical protein
MSTLEKHPNIYEPNMCEPNITTWSTETEHQNLNSFVKIPIPIRPHFKSDNNTNVNGNINTNGVENQNTNTTALLPFSVPAYNLQPTMANVVNNPFLFNPFIYPLWNSQTGFLTLSSIPLPPPTLVNPNNVTPCSFFDYLSGGTPENFLANPNPNPNSSYKKKYGSSEEISSDLKINTRKTITCKESSCTNKAFFGFPSSPLHLFCKIHSLPGMRKMKGKKCLEVGCSKRPSFNLKGLNPQYCSSHKTSDMVNVRTRKCREAKCKEDAFFNFPDVNYRDFCAHHKKDNMIYIEYPSKIIKRKKVE